MSLDLTEKVGQFSGPYMYGYFLKKTYFRNFGTFESSYVFLLILLKSWNNSWDLRDLQDLICMAIYFLKNLSNFETFWSSYVPRQILLKIWNNVLGPLGPYMYVYFFKKLVSFLGPSGPHMYLSSSY